MDELQKNIWKCVKFDFFIVEIVEFLSKIFSKNTDYDFLKKRLADEQIKRIFCLNALSEEKSELCDKIFLNKVLNLWEAAYLNPSVFESTEEVAIHEQEILFVSQRIFTEWNFYLEQNNLIDKTDYLVKCSSLVDSLSIHDVRDCIANIDEIHFHESIEKKFSTLCSVFNKCKQ